MPVSEKYIQFLQTAYSTPQKEVILQNLEGVFGSERIGLVGKNGAGKTTLLRLILGQLAPTSGQVKVKGTCGFLPQAFPFIEEQTLAEAFGISGKLAAIEKIEKGVYGEKLYEAVGEDWTVRERVEQSLRSFGLSLDLRRKLKSLSGGEQARLQLLLLTEKKPDFLLLDEPTNNLDLASRRNLYRFVEKYEGGLIVVSHDRDLLGLVDRIVELDRLRLHFYGGNFDDFQGLKKEHHQALENRIKNKTLAVKKAKRTAVETTQHKSRQAKSGPLGIPRIALGARKRSSQVSQGKSKSFHGEKIKGLQGELEVLRGQRVMENKIQVDLPKTRIPSSKRVALAENLGFGFPGEKPLFQSFHFSLFGPERVALLGDNGSGKTTLLKILLGKLAPQEGRVVLGVESFAYLDQMTDQLDGPKTLLQNVRDANPTLPESEVRTVLGRFLFPNEAALKPAGVLSGGERMKAALAKELLKRPAPQLLVLDEPTNNLDLDSIEQLETALSCFEGAMLVVSHDETFLRNIGISRRVRLSGEPSLSQATNPGSKEDRA